MYTVEEALKDIEYAGGGEQLDIEGRKFIDEAGRKMTGLWSWNWLMRPSVLVDAVALQPYLTLPSDYGQAISLNYTTSAYVRVQLTTLSQIEMYRAAAPSDGVVLHAAPEWAPDSNGVPQLRMAVYRTPTSSSVGQFTLRYRARWASVGASDQVYVPIPEFMEGIYRQFLLATTEGYDKGGMSERIRDVVAGPDWQAACRQDGAQQIEYGPLVNGALSCASGNDGGEWFLDNMVATPAPG